MIVLDTRRRTSVAAAGALAVISPPLLLADPPQPLLGLVAVALLVWAPGQVLAALVDPDDALEEAVVVIAGGMGLNVLFAMVMLYTETWDPTRGVLLVALFTALLAGVTLLRSES